MGSSNSTHARPYDDETLDWLEYNNELVPVRFWTAVASLLVLSVIVRLTNAVLSRRARRRAGRLAFSKQMDIVPPLDKICWTRLPLGVLASFRKISYGRPKALEMLAMGSYGQISLIFGYVALNVGVGLYRTNLDIDWIAHHNAMLSFCQLPVIISLAGKVRRR